MMIGSLRGEIIDKEENGVLIEVGNVGYYVITATTLLDMLDVGMKTQIFTHLHVREQELTLFGFPDKEELELFRTLLKVQGIGPKVALAILSHIPGETLRQAVAKEEAAILPDLAETLEPPQKDDVLELDELWSFVLKKSEKRWVWIALCRRTRQVVAYYLGDRSAQSCRNLWKRIPSAYKKLHSYSDFWEAYQTVFSSETHQSVGKDSGETNHVERWNNTLRQRLARFVRKTLSFSKSDIYHEIVLKLYIFYYNTQWCPIS